MVEQLHYQKSIGDEYRNKMAVITHKVESIGIVFLNQQPVLPYYWVISVKKE